MKNHASMPVKPITHTGSWLHDGQKDDAAKNHFLYFILCNRIYSSFVDVSTVIEKDPNDELPIGSWFLRDSIYIYIYIYIYV
jgi:hypothetical protein